MGCTCPDCKEWFELVYNNAPWNEVRYCPLCGHDGEDKTMGDWEWDEEDDDEEA